MCNNHTRELKGRLKRISVQIIDPYDRVECVVTVRRLTVLLTNKHNYLNTYFDRQLLGFAASVRAASALHSLLS